MKISILQWNVWYREQADNILRFIRNIDADVVCLQELTQYSFLNPGRNLPQELKKLGYQAHYVVTLKVRGPKHEQMGNGIFSKFPLWKRKKEYIQYEDPKNKHYSKENRIYIEAVAKTPSKQLIIGTVHLSYTHGFTVWPEQEAEADRLLRSTQSHEAGFILTGDLNALPDSTIIAKFDKKFVHAGPDYAEATWTTKPSSYGDFKYDGLNWRLDYVYTTPDIKILSSKILDTEYSDHLPILVNLEI